MNPLRKTIIRLVIYGLVLGWIAGDLFWWNGFLSRRIARADPHHPEAIALAKAQGVVARVFNHQITRGQLERALAERLWREGKTPEFLTTANSRIFRYAALNDLIDHELLRVKAKAHATELIIDPAALDARYARFLSRFASEAELLAAARSQGIGGREALRERLAAEMQQEAYVESKIAELIHITPEEMRDWWERHQEALARPERVRVRHIFLPTWQRDADEVKQRMEEAFARLQRGEVPWDELVATLSEDPASKQCGGDLGWMSRDRLPPDFASAVFSAMPGHAVLCQTRIGWHIVEVIERQPARTRSWEEAEPEGYAALRAAKRDKAVREYRDALRRFEAHKIQIFHDRLE
jgi:parvulin-like peptidyl-prolyl isomerase